MISIEHIKLNSLVFPEQRDPRDYQVSRFIPKQDKIEDEEYIMDLPNIELILNQKDTASCVAHAFVVAMEILNWQLTNKIIDFSPMVLYGTRYADHWKDEGMIATQAAEVVYKEGAFYKKNFKREAEVPLIITLVKDFKEKHPELVEEAKKFTISGYATIFPNREDYVNQVKTALKHNMPVLAGYEIYDSFYETKDDGKVPIPNKTKETNYGGHELLIVGWTKNNEWIIVNSWGIRQGFKGMYFIPFSYKPRDIISISDRIAPYKKKASTIEFQIGKDINKVFVDNQEVNIDIMPYISEDNRTMVPLRFISEYFGASVEWIQDTEEIIIRSEENDLKFQINNHTYYINNEPRTMDTTPVLINDARTFVPIRYIAEALKCNVEYKQENNIDYIYIKAK